MTDIDVDIGSFKMPTSSDLLVVGKKCDIGISDVSTDDNSLIICSIELPMTNNFCISGRKGDKGDPGADGKDADIEGCNNAISLAMETIEHTKQAILNAEDATKNANTQAEYAKIQADKLAYAMQFASYYDTALSFPSVGEEHRIYVDLSTDSIYLYHNGYIKVGTSSDWHDIELIDGNF